MTNISDLTPEARNRILENLNAEMGKPADLAFWAGYVAGHGFLDLKSYAFSFTSDNLGYYSRSSGYGYLPDNEYLTIQVESSNGDTDSFVIPVEDWSNIGIDDLI